MTSATASLCVHGPAVAAVSSKMAEICARFGDAQLFKKYNCSLGTVSHFIVHFKHKDAAIAARMALNMSQHHHDGQLKLLFARSVGPAINWSCNNKNCQLWHTADTTTCDVCGAKKPSELPQLPGLVALAQDFLKASRY